MSDYGRKYELPDYLREWQEKIENHARKSGLDFFPQVFEILTFDEMNEVAAYGGFPTRVPHWRWGMEYERLKKSGDYGLSRIYEMVINNNPCVAYLLEGNSLVDQKLVMAHVYAHVDFFKNNFCFKATDQGRDSESGGSIRKWIDTMANHGTAVRRWQDRVASSEPGASRPHGRKGDGADSRQGRRSANARQRSRDWSERLRDSWAVRCLRAAR